MKQRNFILKNNSQNLLVRMPAMICCCCCCCGCSRGIPLAETILTESHTLKDKKIKKERVHTVPDLWVTSLYLKGPSKKVVFLNQDFTIHKGLFVCYSIFLNFPFLRSSSLLLFLLIFIVDATGSKGRVIFEGVHRWLI